MGYFNHLEYNDDQRRENDARSNIVHIENAMRTIEIHKENGIQSKIKLNLSHYMGYPDFNRGFIFMNTRCVDDYVIHGIVYHIRGYHIDHENPDSSYLKLQWTDEGLGEVVDTEIFFGSFLIDETESKSFCPKSLPREELYKKLRSHE
jgi:hypothetical protein